jgi:flagellar protein FliL
MSDAPAEAAPKKKGGKGKKLILFIALPLLLIGGGAGAGIYASGGLGKKDPHAEEEANRPKLMLKGEGEHGTPDTGPVPKVIDPGKYQATYYPMETPFTSNLRDTDGFVQLGLGVSTFYEEKVIENVKRADMPVRSAVLEVLADSSANALNTPDGKEQLRVRLRDAINKVLKEDEGFGGIASVYFTSFIIQ